jgi:hypothetical protein
MGDETLPTKSHGLTKDDIALMVRELVFVTFPHKDPGAIPEWIRRNGHITLTMQPGYKDDPHDHRRRVCLGYPYGSTARLILYWIVTETRRTGKARLELGTSLVDFMRKLGITPDDSTGKRSSAQSVHRQLERLMHARIRFEQCHTSDGRRGQGWLDMPVAKAGWCWWDTKDEDHIALWNGYIILNDDFFQTILDHPVPVRMRTLLALKKSPLGLDLYAWATFESYKAQRHRKGRFVAWKLLHEQFGTEVGTLKNFAAKAQRELRKIMVNCPTMQLTFPRGGVQILASSVPDVPRAASEGIQPLSVPAKAIPSGKALEHVMSSMKTRESAVIIATAFQKAVARGEVDNTDEAYIGFAKQYVA